MAGMDELSELFAPDYTTTRAERFAEAIKTPFLDVFRGGQRIDPPGDAVTWDEVEYSRDLAALVGIGAPSESVRPVAQLAKSGSVIDVREHVDLPAAFLMRLRNPGSPLPDAAGRLDLEIKSLTRKLVRTANMICARALLSAGAAVDMSALPNSRLKGSITWPVAEIDALAAWSNVATKIRSSEITTLQQTFTRLNGVPCRRAIGGPSADKYITQNTEIANTVLGSQTIADRVAQSSFVDGGGVYKLGGIDWIFDDSVYAPAATPDTPATVKADEDMVALLPAAELDPEFFALAEFPCEIPAGSVVGMGGQAANAILEQRRGLTVWAGLTGLETGNVGIRLFGWYRFLPIVKVTKGAASFDMTP